MFGDSTASTARRFSTSSPTARTLAPVRAGHRVSCARAPGFRYMYLYISMIKPRNHSLDFIIRTIFDRRKVRTAGTGDARAMPVSYSPWLVVLSVALAIQGSYVGLSFAVQVAGAKGTRQRALLAGAAITLALGVWTMHFVGMLAERVPFPVDYLVLPTLLSFLVCVIVVGAAVLAVSAGPADPAAHRRRGRVHGARHRRDALHRHGDAARLRRNGQFAAACAGRRGDRDRRIRTGAVARLRRRVAMAAGLRDRARPRHLRHALHGDERALPLSASRACGRAGAVARPSGGHRRHRRLCGFRRLSAVADAGAERRPREAEAEAPPPAARAAGRPRRRRNRHVLAARRRRRAPSSPREPHSGRAQRTDLLHSGRVDRRRPRRRALHPCVRRNDVPLLLPVDRRDREPARPAAFRQGPSQPYRQYRPRRRRPVQRRQRRDRARGPGALQRSRQSGPHRTDQGPPARLGRAAE